MSTAMKFHTLCKLFPPPTPDNRETIKTSIRMKGLLTPIICWKDDKGGEWVVDGRTRSTIIDELIEEGVTEAANGKPITKEVEWWEGDEEALYALVVAKNFERRELSKSQRAALMVDIADLEPKYRGKGHGDYAQMMADSAGVNRQYYFNARKVKEYSKGMAAADSLHEKVKTGELSLTEAMKTIKDAANGKGDGDGEKDAGGEMAVVYDGLKRPVPEELQPIFAARQSYEASVKAVRLADAEMKKLAETKAGKTIPKELFTDFRNVVKQIKSYMPHIPCPYCEGSGKTEAGGRCGGCKGAKYIDKVQAELLPEELKPAKPAGDDEGE